ncbi:MAG: glycosyltransferase [Candidatus Micrarchaeia archaeon]
MGLVRMFREECSAKFMAFSFGEKDEVRRDNSIEEHVLRSNGPFARNQMLDKLIEFNPRVIIVFDRELADIAKAYIKARNGKANVIVLTDSPDVVYNFAMRIDHMRIPGLLKELIRSVYLWRQRRVYKRTINAATHVILPTEEDRARLIALMPYAKSKSYVMQLIPLGNVKKTRPVKKVRKVLFVGACNYPPNNEAVHIIEEKIAPALPNKIFYVLGLGCTARSHDNFSCLGEVSEEELYKTLEDADLCIAPLLHGTGFKSKVLEYLRYGKPVIGTHVAFQGFAVRDRFSALIEDNPEQFARRIKELDDDPALIAKIQKNIPTVLQEFSEEKLRKKFAKFCKSLV